MGAMGALAPAILKNRLLAPAIGLASLSGARRGYIPPWLKQKAPAIFGHFSTVGKNCGC